MGSGHAVLYRRGLYFIFSARGLYSTEFSGKNGAVPDYANDLTGRLDIYIDPLPDGFSAFGIKAKDLSPPQYYNGFSLHPCQCHFRLHDPLGVFYLLWRYRKHPYRAYCLVCLEMAQG